MFNHTIKLVILTLLVVLWCYPQMVGVWEAKKDVAYNAYMEVVYPYNESDVE